jgi:hypothetical protein
LIMLVPTVLQQPPDSIKLRVVLQDGPEQHHCSSQLAA